jgi:triosephosphate isomerase
MRKPMIAGNWKLHKTVEEALDLVEALKDELTGIDDADIIVAPVFTALGKVAAPPRLGLDAPGASQ